MAAMLSDIENVYTKGAGVDGRRLPRDMLMLICGEK